MVFLFELDGTWFSHNSTMLGIRVEIVCCNICLNASAACMWAVRANARGFDLLCLDAGLHVAGIYMHDNRWDALL